MMRLLNRKTRTGQSVLEYVLVLTAVIAGILVAAVKIKGNVKTSLEGAAQKMKDKVVAEAEF